MNLHRNEIGELWDKITPKLYGYLIHTLRDTALADDILQATWLKALEALPRFEERGHGKYGGLPAWLFSIAKNEMRMHWRKGGREIPYDPIIHDIPKDDRNNEDSHENNLLVEQVMKFLPKEDQELFRLRFIADLPIGEMARVLGINPVSARVKMHRALSRARLILKQNI